MCISAFIVVALVFSVVGVALFGNSNTNGGLLGNNGINAVADISSEDYLGRVGNQEAYKKNLAEQSNFWAPIDNAEDLRKFMKGESNGTGKEYDAKQGYLTKDITDFNWGGDKVAPDIDFGTSRARILDGCGYTVTYNVQQSISGDVSSWGMAMTTQKTGKAYGFVIEGSDLTYKVFSLFVTRLGQYGELKNFRFNIEGGVSITHTQSGKNYIISVLGGLVGYVAGGKIDNVCVAMGKKDKSSCELLMYRDGGQKELDNVACAGGGIGFCESGRITNFTFILKEGAKIKSRSETKSYLGLGDRNNGVSLVGGLIGYAFFAGTLNNLAFYGQGGILETDGNSHSNTDAGGSVRATWEIIGGIAGMLGEDTRIGTALISGNLDCMKTNNNSDLKSGDYYSSFRRKNAFVAATRPVTGADRRDPTGGEIDQKLCLDLQKTSPTSFNKGGYTGTAPCAWKDDGSRNDDNREKRSECSDITKGYSDIVGTVAYVETQDGVKAYLDNKDDTYSSIAVFVPDGYVVWEAFGRKRYSDLLSGALCGWNNNSGLSLNEAMSAGMSIINAGKSGDGEVGFYKKIGGGEALDENQGIYQDSKGYKWQEMSDQSRALRNGGEDSPLYYDGTQYELKMLVGDILYDEGLLVENIGNLKDSMNTHNGRPVRLYCDDGGDKETALAYVMETATEKVVIMLKNTTGMERELSIQKRQLFVHKSSGYIRGYSTIFDNVTLRFGRMPNDPSRPNDSGYVDNTGLVNNEVILWQDDRFAQGADIVLDVAGHQMLRPSTNNYIIEEWVSIDSHSGYLREVGGYFSAIIAPQTIILGSPQYSNNDGKHIYINGEAYDGKYEVKNGHKYDDENKNAQKRKITISARNDDAHFTAKGIVLYGAGNSILAEYRFDSMEADEKGLYTIEYLVDNSDLQRIGLLDYSDRIYTINPGNSGQVNGTYGSKAVRYGETVTLSMPSLPEGYEFDGWLINGTENYYSFKQTITFKVTQSLDVTPKTIKVSENPWTIKYYTDYKDTAVFKDGEELRTRRLDNIYDAEWHFNDYKLPDRMGRRHTGWTMVSKDEVTKTASFVAVYDDGEGNNPSKVQVVYNNKPTENDYVFYGSPITLEAKKTYYVNDVEVVVGENPLTIFAITNLSIDEKRLSNVYSQSMNYSSFLRDANGVPTYYISITFVYGKFDQKYVDTTESRLDKPTVELQGFTQADFAQYIRQGNIYQISMVITEKELECRFGHNAEITSFLTVNGYKFDEIMIFKRKTGN